jgi:hypothetical protein
MKLPSAFNRHNNMKVTSVKYYQMNNILHVSSTEGHRMNYFNL